MKPLLKNNSFFQQNLLCNIIHNESNIWFSKFEFILEDFSAIEKLDKEVIVICGNSDHAFTESLVLRKPQNVKYIFATNSTCSDNKVIFSLPIGIESSFDAKRIGHGYGYSFADEKESCIQNINSQNFDTKNLIYSNFSTQTNLAVRAHLNEKIKKSKHVTIENKIPLERFFNQIASHEAVLCPIGNGLDTVRTYETFYCNKIPIIYGSNLIYKEIFFDMPCVYIEDIEEINDQKYISEKIEHAKTKKNNLDKAYLNYWIDKIYQKSLELK